MSTFSFHREEVRTNIPLLDSQHEKYFQAAEEFFDKADKGKADRKTIRDLFITLQTYAIENFDTEEQLMEKEGYPDLDEHRRKHDYFKNNLDSFLEDLDEGISPASLIEDMKTLLTNWFNDQIKNDDFKLAQFLKEKGYGA